MSNNEYPFSDAVRYFWKSKARAAANKAESSRVDVGARSEVTSGKHMDVFVNTISDYMVSQGIPRDCIYTSNGRTLPGFFRLSKNFDLLVVRDGALRVVLELKSHTGSLGNNMNNRVEEALGCASDLWTAYREGMFGTHAPWFGYLMLVGDSEKLRKPSKTKHKYHFPIREEFERSSYASRYETFCRKLLMERVYNGVALLIADKNVADMHANYSEPAPELGAARFLRDLVKAAS